MAKVMRSPAGQIKDTVEGACRGMAQALRCADDAELSARQIAVLEFQAVALLSSLVMAKKRAGSHYIQEHLEDRAMTEDWTQ